MKKYDFKPKSLSQLQFIALGFIIMIFIVSLNANISKLND